jgi:hypothetical protein
LAELISTPDKPECIDYTVVPEEKFHVRPFIFILHLIKARKVHGHPLNHRILYERPLLRAI